MLKYKFTFVVLHYLTIKDTLECVESITQNVNYENYNIVIVDNGSPNNSGELLKTKYNQNERINIIISKENLGFAKGNNLGFNFAKNKLKSDFITLINNDTIIEQQNFILTILKEFNNSNFHILGPDILSTKDNSHQNPRPLTIQNPKKLEAEIKLYTKLLFLNYFLLDKILEKWKKKFSKVPIIKYEKPVIPSWKERLENVKLHGSAMIFSPLYIKKYDGLYPKTFMYSEEAILYYIAKRDGLKTVYSPQIKILHKEDSSTEAVYNKGYKKRRFYYKNFIKSGKVFLALIKESENNGDK